MKHLTLTQRRTFTALFLAAALCVQTLAAMPDRLVPCGHTAGIKLYTGGLLITALDEQAPAQRAGLRAGDTILKIDGTRVSSVQDASLRLSSGKSVCLSVRRGEKQAEFYLTPEKTETGYRLGISVRDNISGIGTITFFDPETGVYGALGHGVAGLTSAQPLAISGGVLVPSSVTDVKKGVRGTPGELHGSFDASTLLGSVSQNEPHGIFGKLTALPQSESVPVADASQIHTGAAVILANVDGKETREYCVRIDKLYPQAENGRNLLLTVTDERLLAVTGGRQAHRSRHTRPCQPPRAGLRHFPAKHAHAVRGVPVKRSREASASRDTGSIALLRRPFPRAPWRLFPCCALRFPSSAHTSDRPRTFWRICTTARS